jgi:hypothetical protein
MVTVLSKKGQKTTVKQLEKEYCNNPEEFKIKYRQILQETQITDDRILIDKKVKKLSEVVAEKIDSNKDILIQYKKTMKEIGDILYVLDNNAKLVENPTNREFQLARTIWKVGEKYNYQGAFLGELNYAITRLIQEVPKRLVEEGKQKSELRYFIYAYTVEALIIASDYFSEKEPSSGIAGVFTDIKDEYKRRVNPAYEVAQIVKSGDCYDTPYHTQPVEVVDQNGKHVGYMEVMIEHKNYDGKDVSGKLVIEK